MLTGSPSPQAAAPLPVPQAAPSFGGGVGGSAIRPPGPGYVPPPSFSHPGSTFGGGAAGSQAFTNPNPMPSNPTPSNPGGSGGGGGSSSNSYLTDPGYLLALQNQQQGNSQINAMLNKQIADAIINYGDPALAQMAGFGLDNQSAAFARQNYLSGNSTLARLDKAHTQARQQVINALAGHGLLFSGDTGYQRGQVDSAYGNNVYDAQHAVLGAIGGYRQTALQEEQSLQQQVVQALEAAYANALNSGQSFGGGGGGGNGPSDPQQYAMNPSVLAHSRSVVNVPQVGPAPRGVPAKAVRSVARALVNPYTTGQKRRG